MILWYLFGLILVLIGVCEIYAYKTGVPTVTSTPAVRKKMREILEAESAKHKSDKPFEILDLGSGTGKLTLEIGRDLPQASITGIEISIVPYILSLVRKFFWRNKNVTYKRENFWPYDISNVNAITIYMTAKIQERMEKKLRAELPTGTLIILNETHLPGWDPIETHTVGVFNVKVVVYRKS